MKAAITQEFIAQRLADLPEALPELQLLVLFPVDAAVNRRKQSAFSAPSSGARSRRNISNRLVHEYETIDDETAILGVRAQRDVRRTTTRDEWTSGS